jgi:hypothetical protein
MKGDNLSPGVLDATQSKEEPTRVKLTSMYIDDQEKALRFSTEVPAS